MIILFHKNIEMFHIITILSLERKIRYFGCEKNIQKPL